MRIAVPVLLVLCGLLTPVALAQTPSNTPQGASPDYTLSVNSRLIVEDVSVVDSKGHAVLGLPKSAFHVLVNNVAQPQFTLEEQTVHAASAPASTDHFVSNAGLLKGGGTMVAILIDPETLEIQDQMYLRIQALHFVDTLPPGSKVAVFRTNNQGIPVELQFPTTDRALIRQAVGATVPVMSRPVDSQFQNAIAELENLAQVLQWYPGNKALFWLAGQFPLFVPPNYLGGSNDIAKQLDQTRDAYRALQEARIGVYPIDARGTVQQGGFVTPRQMTQGDINQWANDPSLTPSALSQLQGDHYNAMDKLAATTGGVAFYDHNAVAKVMDAALDLAQHSYMLSLRPADPDTEPSWHSVRITVDGPYSVHYRQGYFSQSGANNSPAPERRRVLSDPVLSKPLKAEVAQDHAPLQFSARVLPGASIGKADTVKIRYVIPSSQLAFEEAAGKIQSRFRLTAMAYNGWGDMLGIASGIIETHFSSEQQQLAARIGVPADQSVSIRKGAQYLMLAVEDLKTHKVGTVQLQLSTVRAAVTAPGSTLQTQP